MIWEREKLNVVNSWITTVSELLCCTAWIQLSYCNRWTWRNNSLCHSFLKRGSDWETKQKTWAAGSKTDMKATYPHSSRQPPSAVTEAESTLLFQGIVFSVRNMATLVRQCGDPARRRYVPHGGPVLMIEILLLSQTLIDILNSTKSNIHSGPIKLDYIHYH